MSEYASTALLGRQLRYLFCNNGEKMHERKPGPLSVCKGHLVPSRHPASDVTAFTHTFVPMRPSLAAQRNATLNVPVWQKEKPKKKPQLLKMNDSDIIPTSTCHETNRLSGPTGK